MWTEEALRGPLHWLLDFSWAGVTLYLAGHDVTATIGGEEIRYRAGLDWGRTIDQTLSPFGRKPGLQSVSVTLDLYPELDVPDLVSRGHIPGSATGRLLLYAEDTDEYHVMVEGRFRDPQWGAAVEPLVATLEEFPILDDRGSFWTRMQRVLGSTFPDTVSDVSKEYYPIVVGAPGGFGDVTAGSPVYLVDKTPTSEVGLLAGHHSHAGRVGASVALYNASLRLLSNAVASNDSDDHGGPVTLLDMAPAYTVLAGAATVHDKWFALWYDTGTSERVYGLEEGQGNPIRSLGEVIAWALRFSTIRWDSGRIASAANESLNGINIDTYILRRQDEDVSPYTWITKRLLQDIGVSQHVGESGYYLVPWRHEASADQAVAHVDATRDGGTCERVTLAGNSPIDDVVSTIEIGYRTDADSGEAKRLHTISGDPVVLGTEDDEVKPHPWLAESYSSYGPRGEYATVLDQVSELVSVERIASDLAKRRSVQRAGATYLCPQWPYGQLTPGDVVTLTDPDLELDSAVAVVTAVQWTEDSDREIALEVLR